MAKAASSGRAQIAGRVVMALVVASAVAGLALLCLLLALSVPPEVKWESGFTQGLAVLWAAVAVGVYLSTSKRGKGNAGGLSD